MCGEQDCTAWKARANSGSSPRVRGTAGQHVQLCAHFRFIPACAGNSRAEAVQPRQAPVHPRVCGEQEGRLDRAVANVGSSPRVRGTGTRGLQEQHGERFIPACAGNRYYAPALARYSAVHPRVCGEQGLGQQVVLGAVGSSPRVRGTASGNCGNGSRIRFIPACAGNRSSAMRCTCNSAVHPRVCGEQPHRKGFARWADGSSPRVRGTDRHGIPRAIAVRFIPACAGNRSASIAQSARASVHPRVCGEQMVQLQRVYRRHGSSPRVRGTVALLGGGLVGGRFIPACAGNSSSSRSIWLPRSVHPRVCGEQENACHRGTGIGGSSPGVRGTGVPLDLR